MQMAKINKALNKAKKTVNCKVKQADKIKISKKTSLKKEISPAFEEKRKKKTINSKIVMEVISHLVGDDVVDLVIELIAKDDYSEFKLAEKLNMDVNFARNMLYRLLEHNLVSFTRRKDKRKGWYIYYWTFNPNDVEKKRHSIIEKQLSDLDHSLNSEFNHNIFFMCENKCEKYDFDSAVEHEFKCQECGELLGQHDNSSHKQKVIDKINDLRQELVVLKTG